MKDITYIIFVLAAFFCYTNASDLITCPQSDQSFHPHPTNCSLFIECNNGVPAVLTCIEGLHFDEKHGYCNFPEEANCKAEQPNDDENLLICPESGQSFHPHPKNCSLFIECNGGVSEVLVCIEGLHFDPVRGYCNFPEEANCTTEEDSDETDKRCPPEGQHFFPYPYSCSQFIECNDGVYRLIDCIAGLHFNVDLGWCDFPENAVCVESTPAPTTTTEEPKDEGGPVGECPPMNGIYVDFLRDSKDCTIFYMCNWGTPIQMKCPSGLHFNPILNVCDWPWNAGCKVGQ